jgi:aspartate racemase
MTRLSEQIASLTPAQRAAFDAKLRQRITASGSAAERIGRRAEPALYPLSSGQQRLWFVEQLHSGGAAYHISAAVRLEGPLAVTALERSFAEIVRRHEVLRTGFVDDHGRARAHLYGPDVFTIPVVDVPDGDRDSRIGEARRLAVLEAEQPFDLTRGPLLRASLVRLSPIDHVLVFVVHHIAADGWSMSILARELAALYDADLTSKPQTLRRLDIQYADYAAWQQAQLSGPRLAQTLGWWRTELDSLPVVDLPADHPRSAGSSLAGSRESIVIDEAVARGVAELSQRHGVTVFMTLLAAFATLLARWTGETDLAIASPVAGRDRPETEDLVGLFVNTLVYRTDLSGNPSFADLLSRIRAKVTAVLAHQELPFERLIEELQVDRTLSHAPLTPIVFAMQNVPEASLQLAGLRASSFEFERRTARFDLCLFVVAHGARLNASIEYRTDLFEASTIRRMLGCLVRLLRSAIADPTTPIRRLQILDDEQRRQLVADWNATAKPYPSAATIHELVAARAAARPDDVAVVCGRQRLTYGELDRRANQLAHALVRCGVTPEGRVGVCLERGLDLIVALFAALKAGSAYVPLDPAVPPDRLAYMAANASVVAVVCDERSRGLASRCSDRQLLVDAVAADEERSEPPSIRVHPDDLAYISYTSGSTGVPKGVEVCHRAVVRLLCGIDYVSLGPDERLLQLAPVAFDASTFEIWGALIHGGRLVVAPPGMPDFTELAALLRDEGVTTLWLTASLYNAVIDQAPEMVTGVRQLLIGGEALSVEHVRRGLAALPRTTIVNGYGPTEGTTFTCCHRISAADVEGSARSIPIGKPIENTTAFVVDALGDPVPVGVPGELYIGGDGLARGYAADPRLTAARFVPDALSGRPGARLYRSGDLVRFKPAGTIEFLGRRDEQVKVRGYRIELSEIETALSRHPSVRAAVASLLEYAGGRKALVGYTVVDNRSAFNPLALRAFLKERLPDYMVPAFIIPIDEVPLTHNGKVDRAALPAAAEPAEDDGCIAPRNEVEELIVETCRDLLGTARIGVNHNFFELGGHSLLATRLASRLNAALPTDVTVRMVFEAETLGELGDRIVDKLLE